MMIRNFITLMLATLLVGGGAAAAAEDAAREKEPQAFFETTAFTFAPAVEGVVIEHAFTVKNLGSADLKIEKIRTG